MQSVESMTAPNSTATGPLNRGQALYVCGFTHLKPTKAPGHAHRSTLRGFHPLASNCDSKTIIGFAPDSADLKGV